MDVTISIGGLARLTGKGEQELTELLFESVEGEEPKLKEGVDPTQVLLDAFRAKLDKLVEEKKDQYNRGLKEGALKVEKAIRQHGEFDPDLIGEDLVSALVDFAKEQNGGNDPQKLSLEDLDADPTALKWLDKRLAKVKEKYESEKTDLQDKLQQTVQSQQLQTIKSKAFEVLTEKKWNVGEDEQTQKLRRDALVRMLENENLQVEQSGQIVVLDSNNQVRRDELQNPVTFDDVVIGYGQALGGFHVIDPKKTSPGPNPNPPGQRKPEKLVITSEEQYNSLLKESYSVTDHKERSKLQASYHQAFASFLEQGKD